MKAAVVAVGSELLGLERVDTNSLRLTRLLERYGVVLVRKIVVGDDVDAIAGELSRMAAEVDLVVVSGGLGPTADDVTREGACRAFDRELRIEPAIVSRIEDLFARHGRTMAAVNRKQAEVPSGARWIENDLGTAPGIELEHAGCTLFLLPGVPREFDGLMVTAIEPWLKTRWSGGGVERAVVKVACLPESRVEELISPAYDEFGRESITVLAKPGEIHIYAVAEGQEDQRAQRLDVMRKRLVDLAGDAVFSLDEPTSLEAALGKALADAGQTVATAESCTGGLIAERITRVAGSSAYFPGGAVAYANEAKRRDLDVPSAVLAEHGAVSRQVAEALAAGACGRFDVDWGIGVTGVAGPGGGTEDKPVGTVHIAIARAGEAVIHRRCVFLGGDRDRVRLQTSQWALEMLRRRLLDLPDLL